VRKWVPMTENGKRLYLVRPLEKTDIPTFTRWFCDLEDLSAFDRSARIPLGLEASEKVWSDALGNDGKNGKYWFAIDDTDANTIGIVGLETAVSVLLDRLVRIALDENPTLAQSRARLAQAREDFNARAGAAHYPAVGAGISAARQKLNPASVGVPNVLEPGPFTLYNASVSVSYDLDLFGGNRRALEGLLAVSAVGTWRDERGLGR